MNTFFNCKNGQNISWTSVCDGFNQCIDGSDEQNCYCQGDVYPCLQGNNVSCRLACATYGRVTCLSYQNTRACEQYIREYSTINHFDISSTGESSILMNDFDALKYSACLAISILLFISIISILIYLIRKKPSFFCTKKTLNTNLNRKSTNRLSSISHQRLSSLNLSRSYYTSPTDIHDLPPSYHDRDQHTNDSYEPPPYPGPPLFSSDSNYYETIKPLSISNSMSMLNPMPLPEPHVFNNIQTHCV